MLSIREQPSFAAGMYQSVAPERIPPDGAWDIENGLLEEDGTVNRRGGSQYATSAMTGARDLTWIWCGYIGATPVTLVADSQDYGYGVGTAITTLGGAGRAGPTGRAAVMGSTLYLPGGLETISSVPAMAAAPAKVAPFYAVVANRLLAGNGNRIDFSTIGTPGTFAPTDWHQLPDGVSLTGLEGLRDSAVCFTSRGIYIISGLASNLTDADGNVQHRVDRYSRDGVLWGDAGIAGWEGGLVAPMRDGVWVISLGVASEVVQAYRLTSGPIADLYKGYVDAGYAPGGATIYRGHYILPILSGVNGAWVDTLVCRLDMPGTPWTRAVGAGAQFRALAVSVVSGRLFAAGSAGRIYTLNWFDGAASTDVDGSSVAFRLRTRDVAASRVSSPLVKLRAEYELATYDVSVASASDALNTVSAALNARAAAVGGAWSTAPSATDFTVGATGAARAAAADTQYALLGPASVTGKTRVQILLPFGALANGGIVHRYVNAANHARAILTITGAGIGITISKVIGGVPTTLSPLDVMVGPTLAAFYAGSASLRFSATAAGAWTVEALSGAGLVLQSWAGTDAVFATGGVLASGQGGLVDVGDGFTHSMAWRLFSVDDVTATSAALDAYLVEGPTREGYQVETFLGSAPSNLVAGQEPHTYTWPVGQSSRYGRFELRCDDPVSRLALRRFEVFVRDSGRQ
jgi:hypothetical protein